MSYHLHRMEFLYVEELGGVREDVNLSISIREVKMGRKVRFDMTVTDNESHLVYSWDKHRDLIVKMVPEGIIPPCFMGYTAQTSSAIPPSQDALPLGIDENGE